MNQDAVERLRRKFVTHLDDVTMDLFTLSGAMKGSESEQKINQILNDFLKYRADIQNLVDGAIGFAPEPITK